jgi:hypothetical protein
LTRPTSAAAAAAAAASGGADESKYGEEEDDAIGDSDSDGEEFEARTAATDRHRDNTVSSTGSNSSAAYVYSSAPRSYAQSQVSPRPGSSGASVVLTASPSIIMQSPRGNETTGKQGQLLSPASRAAQAVVSSTGVVVTSADTGCSVAVSLVESVLGGGAMRPLQAKQEAKEEEYYVVEMDSDDEN